MSEISDAFKPAIVATTEFATEVAFDKLSELKFDTVKKDLKGIQLPKPPEGLIKNLALHGAARFFNKITYNKVKCLRNWKETSGSKLIQTFDFDKLADGIFNFVNTQTEIFKVKKGQTEDVEGFWNHVKKFTTECLCDCGNTLKSVTGLDQFGKDIDNLTELVLTVVLKNSDPDKPNINDNALTRILQIVGTLYNGDEQIKGFVNATKKIFLDTVFSEAFINNFFEGHKHLAKTVNFVVAAFHVKEIVDKTLVTILENPKNDLNKLGFQTTYQALLYHGLNSFFDLEKGKPLSTNEWKALKFCLPKDQRDLCDLVENQGGIMKGILGASQALCDLIKKDLLPGVIIGLGNLQTKSEPENSTLEKRSDNKNSKLKDLGAKYIKCAGNYAVKKVSESEIGKHLGNIAKASKALFDNVSENVKNLLEDVAEKVNKGVETGKKVAEGVVEVFKALNPNGDENSPGILGENFMESTFERGPEGLATIPEVAEQMGLPQEPKKTLQSVEEWHNVFDEIEDQEIELNLQKAKNQKEDLATIPEVAKQILVEEDSIAGLADFPEVVEEMESRIYLPELQYTLASSSVGLDKISNAIKDTKIEDKDPIQDKGWTWTASYPLNSEFKNALTQGDRITFQIGGVAIEFNENADDLAKDKLITAHNKLVEGNSNADATNAFTEISKIANKDILVKLLPESFKDICEKQGLKLADGKEAIDGKIQYTINITKTNPLAVEYHVAYPLITDDTKISKGHSQEIGTINFTFKTEHKTIENKGWTKGWTRTYELQSIKDLKIEISENQKQEINDDEFIV